MDKSTQSSNERIIPIRMEQDSDGSDHDSESGDTQVVSSVRKLSISNLPSTRCKIDTSLISEDDDEDDDDKYNNITTQRVSSIKRSDADDDDGEVSITRPISTAATRRPQPYSNAPEHIIFVLDCAQDDTYTPFKMIDRSPYCKPLDMLKRSIKFFLQAKSAINKQHAYALITLNENRATWLSEFTTNVGRIQATLDGIVECQTEDVFDLNSLFDVIVENVTVPLRPDNDDDPPDYVVRVVLFYGRSYTMPKVELTATALNLLDSDYFTFDVLMTHEPVDVGNNCSKIFAMLQGLDQKGFGYFFPVSRDPCLLRNSVAKLLAHPLQRPLRNMATYSIEG